MHACDHVGAIVTRSGLHVQGMHESTVSCPKKRPPVHSPILYEIELFNYMLFWHQRVALQTMGWKGTNPWTLEFEIQFIFLGLSSDQIYSWSNPSQKVRFFQITIRFFRLSVYVLVINPIAIFHWRSIHWVPSKNFQKYK